MAEVLIIERQGGLCTSLRRLLTDAGYTVLCEGDGVAALTTLVQHPRPLVTLLGTTGEVDFDAHLFLTLLDVGLIPVSHAYILLTSDRTPALSPDLNALCAAHHIPIVRVPTVIDTLLETIGAAASHLQAAANEVHGRIWTRAGDSSMTDDIQPT